MTIQNLPNRALGKILRQVLPVRKSFTDPRHLDPFFQDVAKFLLEIGCVHINAYGILKHKAGVVLATYEGTKVDWGTNTGVAWRE